MTKNIDIGKAQNLVCSANPDQGRFLNGISEILVATDLTEASRQTINCAVTFARSSNAHLTLLHVYEQSYNLCYLRGSHIYDAIEEYRKVQEHVFQRLGDEVREDYANCSTAFRQGWHCNEILSAATELRPDLMIIGAHNDKWFRRIAYGSDTAAIIRRATCPVLVLREQRGLEGATIPEFRNRSTTKAPLLPISFSGLSSTYPTCDSEEKGRLVTYRRLLVAIDLSEHSKKTVDYAIRLAAFTGASMKLLHVCPMLCHPATCCHGLHIENDLVESLAGMANREANEKLSLVTKEILAKGLKAQPLVRVGSPYEEIVSVAKKMRADLIVIGSCDDKGLGHLLVGSTAERVLQYAPCAVLVVKGSPAARPSSANAQEKANLGSSCQSKLARARRSIHSVAPHE
jgi:universal stress protein A